MGNCLVTKLKGVVDNDNILKLGEIRLKSKVVNTNTELGLTGISLDDISVINNTATITPSRTPFDGWFRLDTVGEHTLKVLNKYNLKNVHRFAPENEEDLKYLTAIEYLTLGSADQRGLIFDAGITSFSILDKMLDLKYLSVSGNLINDNITTLIPTHGNKLETILLQRTPNVIALMSDLGKFPNITEFYVTYSPISGSIESFVASQRGVGNIEKSMTSQYLGGNGKITWKGEVITNVQNNTISWTANTITYNGDTIQNSDVNP